MGRYKGLPEMAESTAQRVPSRSAFSMRITEPFLISSAGEAFSMRVLLETIKEIPSLNPRSPRRIFQLRRLSRALIRGCLSMKIDSASGAGPPA